MWNLVKKYHINDREREAYTRHARSWAARATAPAPVDTARAAAALARLYRLAGLEAPRVMTLRGPSEAFDEARGALADGSVDVGARVFNAVMPKVRTHDRMIESFHSSIGVLDRAQQLTNEAHKAARAARTVENVKLSGLGLVCFAWTAYYSYLARESTGWRDPLSPATRAALEPWFELLEAGVWDACLLSDVAFVMAAPTFHGFDARRRLHAPEGPSISWPDGTRAHHLHGIPFPRHVVEDPMRITAVEILEERNSEIRRVMLEKMGIGRFLNESNAHVLDQDTDGRGMPRRLMAQRLWGWAEISVYVEVTCPSTGHVYYLRVPPETRSCAQAVAWTFGMDAAQYAPLVET